MSTKRRWLIEEATDPETGEPTGQYDREQLMACFEEIEHVLCMVGGMVAFTTERVQVAQLGGQPLAVSRRVIVDWTAWTPMLREEPAPAEEDEPSPELEEAAVGLAPFPEEEDEDVDRSLTTTGPAREDATL